MNYNANAYYRKILLDLVTAPSRLTVPFLRKSVICGLIILLMAQADVRAFVQKPTELPSQQELLGDAYGAVLQLRWSVMDKGWISRSEWKQARQTILKGIQAMRWPDIAVVQPGLSIDEILTEELLVADMETPVIYLQQAAEDFGIDVAARLNSLDPERKAAVIAEARRIGEIGLSNEMLNRLWEMDRLIATAPVAITVGGSVRPLSPIVTCLMHIGLALAVALAVAGCAAATGGFGLVACIGAILSIPFETIVTLLACFGGRG